MTSDNPCHRQVCALEARKHIATLRQREPAVTIEPGGTRTTPLEGPTKILWAEVRRETGRGMCRLKLREQQARAEERELRSGNGCNSSPPPPA